jgi:large subunit ribosomal protein L21
MFAVVRTGGKQYRVAAGDKIAVEKIPGEAGDSVTLGDVLLAGEGGNVRGADGLTVSAEIIAQAKGDKVIVFKKRRRHNYRRKQGHRQLYTILRITAVGDQQASNTAEQQAGTSGEQQAAQPKKAAKGKAAPAAAQGGDQLVAQDAPLKIDGAESPMVDSPAAAKDGVETVAAADGPAAGDASKKKSTKKAKADKSDDQAGSGDAA